MGLFLVIIYIVYDSFKKESNGALNVVSTGELLESFNDFSPYFNGQYSNNSGNRDYLKYKLYKKVDEKLLKRTRDLWENHEEGYIDADFGGVPLVPITIFDTYKKI
jgi:hypothetical protein